MLTPRFEAMARQFPENGVKLLLEDARNVRDLLTISKTDFLDLIDFDRLKPIPTTFVLRDYRHLVADVLLRAPLRKSGRRSGTTILIYILIEHQTKPDELMPLRVIEYVVQVYKTQVRAWSRKHRSFAEFRLQPVLPVVFYTGLRSWDSPGRLVDLMALGERFASVTPVLEPIFLNLKAMAPERLESEGGFFGWLLRLIQERQARPADFQHLLGQVVQHLETIPDRERLRWQEFLSYIQALVYHEREWSEHQELYEVIDASARTASHQREIKEMRQTMADVLIAKGRKEGKKEGALEERRQNLLRLLGLRFGEIPANIEAVIHSTQSLRQLGVWFDRVVRAETLAEIGIEKAGSRSRSTP